MINRSWIYTRNKRKVIGAMVKMNKTTKEHHGQKGRRRRKRGRTRRTKRKRRTGKKRMRTVWKKTLR